MKRTSEYSIVLLTLVLSLSFAYATDGSLKNAADGNHNGTAGSARGAQSASATELAASISQYGITWYFDKAYETGKFANGDYWVVGPLVITRITPDFDGRHNGWEVNPVCTGNQGFEAQADPSTWSPGLVPSLPYTASPGKSIVKAVSLGNCGEYNDPCLKTAAVLTVLAAPPPDNGGTVFRPPYVGKDKPFYSINDLRTELLPSYQPVPNAPTLDWMKNRFERVQLDHIGSYAGRILRPIENVKTTDTYSPFLAKDIGDGALRLMLNDPLTKKMPALIAFVQYGIDLYHTVLNGQTWPPGGGYEPGRKLPLAFAATLFNNNKMKDAVRNNHFWNEDEGVFRGKNDIVLFGDEEFQGEREYWDYITNPPGYPLEYRDPYGYIDGGIPVDQYQFCCLSQPWKTAALAVYLMPAMKPVWGDIKLLEYVDRWVTVGAWTQPDPCAPAKGTYGIDFGPDGNGDCIKDKNPSDGIGRFPKKHGTEKDDGYADSDFAREMWLAYRNSANPVEEADEGAEIPQNFFIQNYPNPFNPNTTLCFSLPTVSYVEIKIYNQLGQLVCVLKDEVIPPGFYTVTWNGKNEQGELVSSGVYLYQLRAGKRAYAQKMLFVR